MADLEPTLSICMFGRNDSYGVDFMRRFEQAMEFLRYSACKAGVQDRLEVLFTDWNCESPMAESTRLSPGAAAMVKFIEVPPSTASGLNLPGSNFNSALGQNVALRRASGMFAAIMPSDILLSFSSLRHLFDVLEGRVELPFPLDSAFLGVPRRFIASHCREAAFFSDCESIERVLMANERYLYQERAQQGLHGSYGLFMLSKKMLGKLRGVDERFRGWGVSDIDLAYRAGLEGGMAASLGAYGVVSYDFDISASAYVKKRSIHSPKPEMLPLLGNSADWGLARESFKVVNAPPRSKMLVAKRPPLSPAVLFDPGVRLDLALRGSSIDLWKMKGFSPASLALANLARLLSPRQYLEFDVEDESALVAFSLNAPAADILISGSGGISYSYMTACGYALADVNHVGSVAFAHSASCLPEPGFSRFTGGFSRIELVHVNAERQPSFSETLEALLKAVEKDCVFLVSLSPGTGRMKDELERLAKLGPGRRLLVVEPLRLALSAPLSIVSDETFDVGLASIRWSGMGWRNGGFVSKALSRLDSFFQRLAVFSRIAARCDVCGLPSALKDVFSGGF